MEEYLKKYESKLSEYSEFESKSTEEIVELKKIVAQIEKEMSSDNISDDYENIEKEKNEELVRINAEKAEITSKLEYEQSNYEQVSNLFNQLKIDRKQKSDDLLNKLGSINNEEEVMNEIYALDEQISENEVKQFNIKLEIEGLKLKTDKIQEAIEKVNEELNRISVLKDKYKENKHKWVESRAKITKIIEEVENKKNILIENINEDISLLKQENLENSKKSKIKTDLVSKEIAEKEKVIDIVSTRSFDEPELQSLQERTVIRLKKELELLEQQENDILQDFNKENDERIAKLKELEDLRNTIFASNVEKAADAKILEDDEKNKHDDDIDKHDNNKDDEDFSKLYDDLCESDKTQAIKHVDNIFNDKVVDKEDNKKDEEISLFETTVEECHKEKGVTKEDIFGEEFENKENEEKFEPIENSLDIGKFVSNEGNTLNFNNNNVPLRWVRYGNGDMGLEPIDSYIFLSPTEKVKRNIRGFVKKLKKKFTKSKIRYQSEEMVMDEEER